MRAVAISLVSSILAVTLLAWSQASSAQVPLILQTTFDDASCPTVRPPGEHWRQSDYFTRGVNPCTSTDGILQDGGWTANGVEDRIIAEANFPGGGGGKGFRHYRCDGWNCNGGGIRIEPPTGHAEMWGRFYMRYQLGFAWQNGQPHYTKDLYVNVGSPSAWVFGIQGGGSWGIYNGSTAITSSKSWVSTMGGATGDGQWHCYEWHIKHGPNARIEIWVDDVQVLNATTNMPSGTTASFVVGSNQNAVTGAGATPWYTDYDDFALSATGRIGCIGVPGQIAAPRNLRVR